MNKKFSIAALVVGVIGYILSKQPIGAMLAIAAIVLAIIGFKKEKAQAMSVLGFLFGILILSTYITVGKKPDNKAADIPVETQVDTPNYEYVFCAYLIDDAQKYNNKYVSTIIPVDNVADDRISTVVEGLYPGISSNHVDTSGISEGDWIKLSGKVNAEYTYDIEFTDATLEKIDRPATFDADMERYAAEKQQAAIAQKNDFINNAAEVSYEDLRRYPDTYSEKPIRLTINVKEVEPDGKILHGDILAEFDGQEISVYDARAVREPRLMVGDTLTVYAQGNGLTKIKEKDGSGLFAKTINEYEIPSIRLVYTDYDKDENVEPPREDGDLTQEGREAGEKMLETLKNIDW